MIVVAIIGILSAIAVPAYQDYTIRSRVTEALTVGSEGKAIITENLAAHATDSCLGINTQPVGHISSIICNNGILTLTMDATAGNAVVVLTPGTASSGPVNWVCSGTPHRYVPSECRN